MHRRLATEMLRLLIVLFCTATSFAQTAAVKVSVAPLAQPNFPVRVSQVEITNSKIMLRIENSSNEPVIAVNLEYLMYAPAECTSNGKSAGGGQNGMVMGDGERVPGMVSIDIPAHGSVWFEPNHLASRLAVRALKDLRSRYSFVHPGIRTVFFAGGANRTDLKWEEQTSSRDSEVRGSCAGMKWVDSADAVRGYQLTSGGKLQQVARTADSNGSTTTYTCDIRGEYVQCLK